VVARRSLHRAGRPKGGWDVWAVRVEDGVFVTDDQEATAAHLSQMERNRVRRSLGYGNIWIASDLRVSWPGASAGAGQELVPVTWRARA
jgi:hypothetical protein